MIAGKRSTERLSTSLRIEGWVNQSTSVVRDIQKIKKPFHFMKRLLLIGETSDLFTETLSYFAPVYYIPESS
jgi:hypothetical protein